MYERDECASPGDCETLLWMSAQLRAAVHLQSDIGDDAPAAVCVDELERMIAERIVAGIRLRLCFEVREQSMMEFDGLFSVVQQHSPDQDAALQRSGPSASSLSLPSCHMTPV